MRTLAFGAFLALALLAGPGAPDGRAAGDPMRDVQWALDAIHLQAAKRFVTGAGALVAVVDSGVDAGHPDLAGRVIAGPDLIDGDGVPNDPTGHGTHIAGIIAASAGNGIGGAGVAPAARILAVRVLDGQNNGTPANIAAGIDAAVDAGARVVNLSLNWSQASEPLAPVTAAMHRAAAAGVVLVVAAGNNAQGRCEQPVLPRQTLCVGAVATNLRLAPFSSYGHGLGLVAPGDELLSTWRNNAYRSLSGTSQAAAVASGVAALLVGLGVRGNQVMQRLLQSARDVGTPGPDARSGSGLLDADRAIESVLRGRPPAVVRATSRASAPSRLVGRRGLLVACDAARRGVCRVIVRVRGIVVARGATAVDGTRAFGVIARPTPAGRRLLAAGRAGSAVVETSLAGAAKTRWTVALRAG
jgi:subtilisin family serine protease